MYIQLKEERVLDNIDIEDGVTIDIDEKGHIIGIEILDATKKLSRKDLSNIIIENLPLEKVETASIKKNKAVWLQSM
ncbi:MAG: DUF2283 domain-containing protein [Candidatus Brocadia sp.]|nr:DUF2283 domain-containing protein [Candidatus Brocadia sp.]